MIYTMFVTKDKRTQQGGFSLVEAVIVSALVVLVFSGLFAGLQLMVAIIGSSKAEAGARALAVARLEYVRSLPYDSVGTVAGIPSGNLPQTSTTTLNGVNYTETLLVQYKDRPEDGFGVDDQNGVTADSKVAKVTYSWNDRGTTKSVTLISDIIPKGIESTTGGGTLFINVFDAAVQPVSGATVHIFNDTVATDTIDVSVNTNTAGIANFPGAPARSGYQVSVTKNGYSSDQTYSASTTNSSPNPPHVSVIAGSVSTVNFAIDELSALTIRTLNPPVTKTTADTFTDDSQVTQTTNVVVTSGELQLANTGGVYETTGSAYAASTTPAIIDTWNAFDVALTEPAGTSVQVHLYSVSGSGTSTTYALVPDTELPGNSTGFTSGPIDISSVDPTAYPALALGASLSTSDTTLTPAVTEWQLSYIESSTPISNVTLRVVGQKNIGENSGVPVLKYDTEVTSDSNGIITLPELEWDSYSITIDGATEGYDIVESTKPLPLALAPGISEELDVMLEPHVPYSLRTTVTDTEGTPIANASVQLTHPGYNETQETSIYGQTFFTGMSSSTVYTLTVNATGYAGEIQENVSITGNEAMLVTLPSE